MKICITGASRGLGRELCRACIAAGHTVWGVARNEGKLKEMEQELGSSRFFSSTVDIARETSVLAWRGAMEARGFMPDIVILNASVQSDDLLEGGYDSERGRQMIDVNLSGSLRCIGILLPAMLRRAVGSFVAITSTAMLRPSVRSAAYAAGKAGIAMAMRSLDLKYSRRGVRFQTVCLGPIATEMWEGKRNMLVPSPEKAAKAIAAFIATRKSVLYYPWFTLALLRLSLWLPDAVFAKASTAWMK